MRIHLTAVGGAIMHNLAIALQENGHEVSGTDDEIYNPAKDRLAAKNLLPGEIGWHPELIDKNIDLLIAGMHARADNPELAKAEELGIKITSFPEFIYHHSVSKKRIVIAGSHGKTTTTSMIMHALRYWKYDFDYLVGAQLDGFENMVKLSEAPLIVIEGDEYLSAAFDRRAKFLHYRPHLAIITGIAWDHINVFPEFEGYVDQFRMFLNSMEADAKVFYAGRDTLLSIVVKSRINCSPYFPFEFQYEEDRSVVKWEDKTYKFPFFGLHNFENMAAAAHICKEVGLGYADFLKAMEHFKGAAKRLQLRKNEGKKIVFHDFAHAPSKVKASINAVRNRFPKKKLIACVELHTFSSLNEKFHHEYKGTFDEVDVGVIFYNEHTLRMKKMPPIDKSELKKKIGSEHVNIISDKTVLKALLEKYKKHDVVYLMMSSGTFQGLDLESL